MRILILSQHYWPEPITKATELAEGLAANGHQVTVVTGFPNYPSGEIYASYRLKPWSVERVKGVKIVRTFLFPSRTQSTLGYVANLISFTVSASILGPIFSGPVDVIYVRHPPLTEGIPSLILKYLRRAPVVYAMHDLWPESIVELGRIRNRLTISLLDRFERFLMRRVEIVGLSSPGFVSNITGKGIGESKIRLLPDWVDELVYSPGPASQEVAERFGMSGRSNIVFAGNVGRAQDLDTVLDAAKTIMERRPNIQFVIVGGGVDLARLKQRVDSESIENVIFIDPVAPDVVCEIFRCAKGLLVHLKPGFLADVSVALKTYSYMAVGKPILMGVGGASKQLVEEGSLGITFEPGNAESLVGVVSRLDEMNEADLDRMGEAGSALFLAKYSKSIGVTTHEELFEGLVNGA